MDQAIRNKLRNVITQCRKCRIDPGAPEPWNPPAIYDTGLRRFAIYFLVLGPLSFVLGFANGSQVCIQPRREFIKQRFQCLNLLVFQQLSPE